MSSGIITFRLSKDLIQILSQIILLDDRGQRMTANGVARKLVVEALMQKSIDQRSQSQRDRQKVEHRHNGRYSKVNPCCVCGKSAGVNYFSHRKTDTDGWGDEALVLCKKCADATDHIEDVEEFLEYKRKVVRNA